MAKKTRKPYFIRINFSKVFWQASDLRKDTTLFVFSIVSLKQNAGSLLTNVSDTVFYALSYGTLGFALHGSFFNHSLIGGNSSTANQIL